MESIHLKTDTLLDNLLIREQIFNQAEMNVDIGTFYWNLTKNELFYSDNFYRLLGCEPQEFEPNIDYFNNTFLHPEDRARIELARHNAQKNKISDTWQYRIITRTGEIKHVKAVSKIIEFKNNDYLVGTLQDVTSDVLKIQQLNKRQEELRLANIELKTSLKVIQNAEINAGLGHWHINLENNEFILSETLQKLSGYSRKEDLTFENIFRLVHPDDRHNLIETCLKDYQNDKTSISIFRIVRHDGQIRYIKGTSDRMKINKSGYIVGIAQDITSLVDKEIMLEEKNLQLERQNEELASFNHMASHDLQEPLRKIQVLSKMILDKDAANLSADSLNYFNRMTHSANRMQTLINDLLDYSRANNPSSIKVMYDLNKVVKEAKHNLKEDIVTKNAKVISSKLPVIEVIPSQMLQLFTNLIDNALKYSRVGVPPVIKINSLIVPGEMVTGSGFKKIERFHCITITDNGIGFDQQYSNKIFEIFQRLHSKSEYSGTGIGLTICKKIIQNHNGYITATGIPGRGSSFSLYFPIEPN